MSVGKFLSDVIIRNHSSGLEGDAKWQAVSCVSCGVNDDEDVNEYET